VSRAKLHGLILQDRGALWVGQRLHGLILQDGGASGVGQRELVDLAGHL
jgi:hypothetical protein